MTYSKELKQLNINNKSVIKSEWILLILVYVSCSISYISGSSIGSLVVLFASLIANESSMKKMAPAVIFFYSYLYLPFIQLSVFFPYCFLFIIKNWYRGRWHIKVTGKLFCFLLLNFLFCFFVLGPLNIVKGLSGFIGVVFSIVFASSMSETNDTKNVFRQFIISALLGGFLSILFATQKIDYMMLGGINTTFSRFLGTFSDPNYTGLFYQIGVWAAIILKPLGKHWSYISAAVLFIFMLLTISIATVIVFLISIFIYVIVKYGFKSSKLFLIPFGIFIVIFIIYYLGGKYDIPYISDLVTRINSKIYALNTNDYRSFSTGRSTLASDAMKFFITNDNVWNILFGGICTTAIYATYPAIHNEFISLLFNIGIIGTAFYLPYLIGDFIGILKKRRDDDVSFRIMAKSIVVLYSMTLTMFMDFRFLLLFLI